MRIIVIEVTRGNTATHPPNYFMNGQQRQPSLRPDLTPTFPPTGSTEDSSNGDYRTHDFPSLQYPVDHVDWENKM